MRFCPIYDMWYEWVVMLQDLCSFCQYLVNAKVGTSYVFIALLLTTSKKLCLTWILLHHVLG